MPESSSTAASRPGPSPELLDDLVRWGAEGWREASAGAAGRFQRFVPADAREAWTCLSELAGSCSSFLELGSGVGVITVMADLLGLDAVGIEIDPELVELSRDLAERCGSGATFVEGSFVPPEFRDEVELLSGDFLTVTEGADAYAELGLEMADFDLVYAYPWPGEEDWTFELVRRHAGPRARLLTYGSREGFELVELDR